MSLSDRTVGVRDKVFAIESGECFSPFSNNLLRAYPEFKSFSSLFTIPEQYGHQIIYFSEETSTQVVQADHGKRAYPFAHP